MIREAISLAEKKYINSTRTMKEIELMKNGNIPITPSLLKEFERPMEMYHVTDTQGLRNLIKIQNQKKVIAGFTQGSHFISDGALTDGGVLVKLKGQASWESAHDVGTILDRNGNRWILWDTSTNSSYIYDNFTSIIYTRLFDFFDADGGLNSYGDVQDSIDKLDGKGKQQFIKFYFDEARKLMTKKFKKELTKIQKEESDKWFGSDEVLMHSAKIIDVNVIVDDINYIEFEEEDRDIDIKSLSKSKKLKYSGYITKNQIAGISL